MSRLGEFAFRASAGMVGALVVAVVGIYVGKALEDRNTTANRARVKALIESMPGQRRVIEGAELRELIREHNAAALAECIDNHPAGKGL